MKPLFFILEFNSVFNFLSLIFLVLSIIVYVITIKNSREQKLKLEELQKIIDEKNNQIVR